MKNIGIWLDKDKAHIVTIENEVETFQTVLSKVEHFNPHGGSGTRQKGGPQDVVQDSKYLDREKKQLKQYFKALAFQVKDAQALVIFGPADINKKFRRELYENHTSISEKIKDVIKTDSMTDNQIKAWVRDFFASV